MRLDPRAVRLLPLLLPILLLPMGREALGQEPCPQSPQLLGLFQNLSAEILEIAAVDSKLILAVKHDTNDFRVWVFDGQSARQLLPSAGSPSWPIRVLKVGKLTVLKDQVFFAVEGEFDDYLWVTEGLTSIRQVGTEPFLDFTLFEDEKFAVLGDWLYFRGKLGSNDANRILWRSDGARVEPVKDTAGNDVIEPSGLAVLGSKLFFAAKTGNDSELWVFESALGRARLFQDLWRGGSSSPASLTAVGSKLYFTATAAASENMSLWVLKENAATAEVVAGPSTLGDFHGDLKELTAVGDKLFFHMEQSGTGDELWVSDGAANTQIIEIQGGVGSAAPHQLTAVGRMLFFIANNGTSGKEPWRSDGTPAGTTMVRDFYQDSSNNAPLDAELKAGPGVLLLSVYETTLGKQLWSVSDPDIVQLTNIGLGLLSSAPRHMTILGDKLYFVAKPTGQDEDLYALDLIHVDCRAPSVTCPGPLQIEAVSPRGAYVFLPPPVQMSDNSFTPLTVSYSPASFALFGVDNSTPATITARDLAGREGTCSVIITVQDTRGPELVCPASLTVEATSSDGANVSYPVEAWDAVSGVSSVSAVPPSGSHFRLGQEARVTVIAEDGKDNLTTCEFSVTVKDTQPPKLTCPRDIVHVATSAEPIPVTYAPLELEDATGATLVEDPQHPSGSSFELGRTEVTLEAVDAGNRRSQCTFSVYVVDPVAPTITCPGPQQAVAIGPEGAAVEFPEASAEDALGPPTLRYSAEPGSTFPVGETTVTATATDRGGNEASCSFTVTITGPGQEVPASGCACGAGPASASVYWLLLALAPLWARRRISRLAR